jgi:hypothetical protein
MLGGKFHPLAQPPDMAGVDQPSSGHAVLLGAADAFQDGEVCGHLAETPLGIHRHRRTRFMHNGGARSGLEVATPDGIKILAHAHAAMRIVTDQITPHKRGGDQAGNISGRTRRCKDAGHELNQCRRLKQGHESFLLVLGKVALD